MTSSKLFYRNKAKQEAGQRCFSSCLQEVDGQVKINLVVLIRECGEDNWVSITSEKDAKVQIEQYLHDNDFHDTYVLSKMVCEVDFDKQIIVLKDGYYEIEDKYVDKFTINDYEFWVEEIEE